MSDDNDTIARRHAFHDMQVAAIAMQDAEYWTLSEAGRWREQWVAAWAAVGWLASTDLLQAMMVRDILQLVNQTKKAMIACMSRVDNLQVDVGKLIKLVWKGGGQ